MRFILKLSPNTETVPFNYQQKLLGVFHKWLGENNPLHDALSLYSFSWLEHAELTEGGYNFPAGSFWSISFWDAENLKSVLNGISKDNSLFCGMQVQEVVFEFNRTYRNGSQRFTVQSPILIKKPKPDSAPEFLVTHSVDADAILTTIMKRKLEAAGLDDDISIKLDSYYQNIKTKLVSINGIENRCFYCPVIITGSGRAIEFARITGVGHSTGSGFGFIK